MNTPKPLPTWMVILIVVLAVAGTGHIITAWGWIVGAIVCAPGLWWTYKLITRKVDE